jgi:hypothetical protein
MLLFESAHGCSPHMCGAQAPCLNPSTQLISPVATNNLAMDETCFHGRMPSQAVHTTQSTSSTERLLPHHPPCTHQTASPCQAVFIIQISRERCRQYALQHLRSLTRCSCNPVYSTDVLQAATPRPSAGCNATLPNTSVAPHHALLSSGALQPPQQAYISVCCESKHVDIHNL